MRTLTFINDNPAQSRYERDRVRSQASSHAASVTIAERKQARLDAKSKASSRRNRPRDLRPKSLGKSSSDVVNTPDSLATDSFLEQQAAVTSIHRHFGVFQQDFNGVTSAAATDEGVYHQMNRPLNHLGEHAGYSIDQSENSKRYEYDASGKAGDSGGSESRFDARSNDALPMQPSGKPDWSAADLGNLHFFLSIVGNTTRLLSDGSFFNVIVPSLSENSIGIRYLISAIASTYRTYLSPVESSSRNIEALEYFDKASGILSRQSTMLSDEILSTSCVLIACWYSLRLEILEAAACIKLAVELCHLRFDESLVEHTLHPSDPRVEDYATEEQGQSQKSNFQKTIDSTVSKRAIDGLPMAFRRRLRQDTGSNTGSFGNNRESKPLILAVARQFRPLDSLADILYNIAAIMPIWEQLFGNTTHDARLNPSSRLAQDLLSHMQLVLMSLEQRSFGVANSNNVFEQRESNFGVGVLYHYIELRCTLLLPRNSSRSASVLAWDSHVLAFDGIVSWAERYLRATSKVGGFEYFPNGLVIRPLWFAALHCRESSIRRRAIECLLTYHRNEAGLDSWTAGQVANAIMCLEERNVAGSENYSAAEIMAQDRILLVGFEFSEGSKQPFMLYTHPAGIDQLERHEVKKHKLKLPEDPHGVIRAKNPRSDVEDLKVLTEYMARAKPEDAGGRGYMRKMWYVGEQVEVFVD